MLMSYSIPLLTLSAFLPVNLATPILDARAISQTDYDVLVIGGGPSGLSALSGLARVRRKALLLDSGVYRNDATRHMHDVIGNDGTVPAVFRARVREQISTYPTVSMMNATVANITSMDNNSYFIATDSTGRSYSARKVVLGTGVLDVLSDTPGVKENFGEGMFWCPWCDGYEHRDQPLGVLGPMSAALNNVWEVATLNKDIVIFANGTYTNSTVDALNSKSPTWLAQLQDFGVGIDNRSIASITRLRDGSETYNTTTKTVDDLYMVAFEDGTMVQRSAFIVNFPTMQHSSLGPQLGVEMDGGRMAVNISVGAQTSVPGAYAVGDANSDGSTNVPHAMWTGKRAAVSIHVKLAREEFAAMVAKRDESRSEEELLSIVSRDVDAVWEEMIAVRRE
ncbi:MAG: hypothetical protein M1818_004042 [Claussenomyces sp. TS43310]|nr:MAG: hypothetical protein M1818_004042 [Claussenomyces sp. TS43310]